MMIATFLYKESNDCNFFTWKVVIHILFIQKSNKYIVTFCTKKLQIVTFSCKKMAPFNCKKVTNSSFFLQINSFLYEKVTNYYFFWKSKKKTLFFVQKVINSYFFALSLFSFSIYHVDITRNLIINISLIINFLST